MKSGMAPYSMLAQVWKLKDRTLEWQWRPLIMGILNVTPDSFSDGGQYLDPAAALDRALELEAQGADILDLGGESSRPGSTSITPELELSRVLPVLQKLRGRLALPISIDTWKASVAEAALGEGAAIVNDISAGRWDPPLWPIVAKARAGYVLMHALAQPGTQHDAPNYADVTAGVMAFLRQFLTRAEENGIALESVVCDPGFGFGKTLNQNLTLMRDLADFQSLGRPALVGLSRKSFLKLIGGSDSLALTHDLALIWAAARGATIWRVHDVPAAQRAARVVAALGRGADTA